MTKKISELSHYDSTSSMETTDDSNIETDSSDCDSESEKDLSYDLNLSHWDNTLFTGTICNTDTEKYDIKTDFSGWGLEEDLSDDLNLSHWNNTSFTETTYDSDTETDSSDCDSEEDLSCGLNNPYFPESSFLTELKIPLTESEKSLIDKFYQKMEAIEQKNDRELTENTNNRHVNCTKNALKRIKRITDKYLNKGIRLNSCYGDSRKTIGDDRKTTTDFIFEKIKDILDYSLPNVCTETGVSSFNRPNDSDLLKREDYEQDGLNRGDCITIIKSIIKNLIFKGGKVNHNLFCYDIILHATHGYEEVLFPQCQKIKNKLQNIAYESIVNEKDNLKVEIDNGYFYVQYSQESIVEVAKIITNQEVKDLNLRVGILQIGKSIIRVESVGDKRNYINVFKGSIKMSFNTEVGKIGIHLHHIDSNKVRVELCEESKERFCKLKNKSSLGENCLLGGKSVLQAIKDGEFIKNKELDAPSTFVKGISINHIFDSLKNSFSQFGKYILGV